MGTQLPHGIRIERPRAGNGANQLPAEFIGNGFSNEAPTITTTREDGTSTTK